MKITFTISPNNTSFPILIINDLEASILPRIPRQPFYDKTFPVKATDIQKGKLEISGVIRGKATTKIELTINAYVNGATKPPYKIPLSGIYSNKGSFLFMTTVPLP